MLPARSRPPDARADLAMAHRFVVTAGSRDLGAWSKVSGLAVTWDLADHRVGDSDQYVKYAVVPKFEQIKLSRAAERQASEGVRSWLEEVQAYGRTRVPEEGSITMLSSSGEVVMAWTLWDMFPLAWQISDFDANSSNVAVETLKIVHSGFLAQGAKYNR